MKVFINANFRGHYPVGSAAVVVANNAQEAAQQLEEALARQGLAQSIDPKRMIRLPTNTPTVSILVDGNY